MKTIVIHGLKGSGKTTLAKSLKESYENDSKRVKIVSFATPLKRVVAKRFNMSIEEVDKYKLDTDQLFSFKGGMYNIRTILQQEGDILREEDEHFFVRLMINQLSRLKLENEYDIIIIDDLRFRNEFGIEVKEDYVFIKLEDMNNPQHDRHESEQGLDDIYFDFVFDNTVKSKDEMKNFVKQIKEKVETLNESN